MARAARRWLGGEWKGEERRALARLAPVLHLCEGIERWPEAARRSLARAIRAKAARGEKGFLEASREHVEFAAALRTLGRARS
jgi:hypothetical protein